MAKVSGITVAIKADTSGVTAGLKELTSDSIKLAQQLKSVDALLNMDPKNTELLAERQKILANNVETTKQKLESLKAAQDDVTKAYERGDIGTEQYLAFQRELTYTEDRLKSLTSTEADNAAETQKAAKESSGFGEILKSVVAKGAELAVQALKDATEAVVGFAKDSVQTGMDFDKAVSQIGATMGYTVEELHDSTSEASQSLQTLRGKAQEMGAATSFSATEAAEALNVLAMSGYDAETSCGMVADVLNLAQAGSLGLADAAKYTSGAVKGFADDSKDAAYYTDLMALGATKANTDVNALGAALSKGASTAASYKQSAESTTVALLRLAEQGSTGEEAATKLNRAMADLYTPTEAAKKALTELGVSAYDEATGSFRDVNTVVDELNSALKNYGDEQAAAYKNAIFTTNGLNAFNQMTVTSTEKVAEWTDALKNAEGAAKNQADTMRDNLSGDIDVFNSTLEAAKLAVSDKLSATVRSYVKFGTESISALTEAFKSGGIEGMTDTLTSIFDSLIQRIGKVIPVLVKVAKSLLTAFGTAVIRNLPEMLRTAASIVKELADGIIKALPELIPAAIDVILEIVDILTQPDTLGMLVDAAIQIIIALTDGIINSLPVLLERLPEIVDNIVTVLVDNVPKLLTAAYEIIKSLCGYLFNAQNIKKILDTGVSILKKLIEGVLSLLYKVGEAAQKIVAEITDKITSTDWLQVGKDVINGFMQGVVDAWNSWSNWWQGFGEYIYDALHPGGDEQTDLTSYAPVQSAQQSAVRDIIGPQNMAGGNSITNSSTNSSSMTVNFGDIVVNGGDKNAANDFIQQVDKKLRDLQVQRQRGIGGAAWLTS